MLSCRHQEKLLGVIGGRGCPGETFLFFWIQSWLNLGHRLNSCSLSISNTKPLISEVFDAWSVSAFPSLELGALSWSFHSFLGLLLFLLTIGYCIACHWEPTKSKSSPSLVNLWSKDTTASFILISAFPQSSSWVRLETLIAMDIVWQNQHINFPVAFSAPELGLPSHLYHSLSSPLSFDHKVSQPLLPCRGFYRQHVSTVISWEQM